jgi:hypothetical protein
MTRLSDFVELRTVSGTPIEAGGARLTPQSQALVVRTPLWKLVWNRPVAVLVERDGREQRLPIVDVTRVAIVALFAGGLAGLIAVAIMRGVRRSIQGAGE